MTEGLNSIRPPKSIDKFFALVRAQLIMQFSGKSGNMKKWTIYLILFLSFLPILAGIAFSVYFLGVVAAQENIMPEVFSVLLGVSQIVIVILGLITILSTVYFSTDNEMLLGLPLRPRTIFLSKLFMVYINELMLAAVLALATLVPFGIGSGAGVLYYLFLPFVIILLPLLPILLASLLSVPIMYAVSFFRNRGAITSIAVILIFGLFFGGYMLFSVSGGNFAGDPSDITAMISAAAQSIARTGRALFPNYVLGIAAFAGGIGEFIWSFGAGIAILAALLVVAVFIANFCYNRSIAILESPKSKNKKTAEFREDGNITWTLIKKDFLEMLKDPGIAVQCLLAVVIMPLLIVVMTLGFEPLFEGAETELDAAKLKDLLTIVVMAVEVFMVIGINITSATSITRENRNFYLMKIMPVSFETQIKAKAYLGSAITAAAIVISNVIVLFILKLNVFYMIFATVFLVILGHAFSLNSTGLDLKRPRLNWQTVQEGLKNNSASLFGILYSLVAFFILVIICGGFYIWYLASGSAAIMIFMWSVLILLALLTMYLMQKKLLSNIEQKFDAIED